MCVDGLEQSNKTDQNPFSVNKDVDKGIQRCTRQKKVFAVEGTSE
jgi:hypothetical protein